jgi:hypothetical protein
MGRDSYMNAGSRFGDAKGHGYIIDAGKTDVLRTLGPEQMRQNRYCGATSKFLLARTTKLRGEILRKNTANTIIRGDMMACYATMYRGAFIHRCDNKVCHGIYLSLRGSSLMRSKRSPPASSSRVKNMMCVRCQLCSMTSFSCQTK